MLWMPTPIVLPDEHRIYQATLQARHQVPQKLKNHDHELGHWAVADNSGDWPDQTDDGTLWLDFTTNIMLGRAYGTSIHIPLLDPASKASTFVTNPAALLILVDMFRWTINSDGKLYRVVRW
jgi:hypothetical protein